MSQKDKSSMDLQQLCSVLAACLSTDQTQREAAEAVLKQVRVPGQARKCSAPEFRMCLFELLLPGSLASNQDRAVTPHRDVHSMRLFLGKW